MSLFDHSRTHCSFAFGLFSNRPHRFSLATLALLAFVFIGMAQQAGAQTLTAAPVVTFNGIATTVGTGSFTLFYPTGVAVDGAGNIYIADSGNNRVVEVTAAGQANVLSTSSLPGTTAGASNSCPTTGLCDPDGGAVDGSGNLYIADTINNRVVKVTAGVASVLPVVLPANTPGGTALYQPNSVAVDGAGDVFIADTGNNLVVKVTGDVASVLPVVLPGGTPGGTDLNGIYGLAADAAGDVFIADCQDNRVVEVTAAGVASVLSTGSLTLSLPKSVLVDGAGDVYIGDAGNNRVVEVTVAGGASVLGTGSLTLLNTSSLALDGAGNLYIADVRNNRVVEVSPAVNFGAVAVGSAAVANQQTLTYTFQSADTLTAVKVLTQGVSGKDFIADASSSCVTGHAYGAADTCTVVVDLSPAFPGVRMGGVQLVDANGVQATTNLRAVGQGSLGVFQPGVASVINVGTPGGLALSCPSGLAMDGTGNVYIADECNARVVEVPAAGVAKVFSTGSLTLGTNPQGVAVDGAGNVYIADTSANRVVEVTAAGAVSVLNTGNLTLSQPSGVAVDGAGNVYISDEFNNRVVELWTMGVASVLNTASLPGTTDGENNDDCNTTGLCEPHGLAVDSGGDVFIADTDNNRVVEVTAAGVASVLSTGSLTLSDPYDVVVDGAGDVYITDGGVVEVTPAGVASVLNTGNPGGTPMAAPWGIVVNGAGDLYLTDWANGLLVEVNQAQQSLSFAATPVGQTSMDSPQNVTVQNIGNQPLVFAAVATATTGQTLNSFNLNGSATTCTGSTSLTAGESCGLGVEFVPLTAGLLAGTVNILDNSLNAIFPNNMQQISLSGFVIAATTTSLSAPSNSTVGASVTLTATVLAGTTPVTTGTVTFLNGTTSIGTGAVNGSGVATLSLTTLPLGADSITASFAATTSDAASTSGASVVTVGTVSTTPDFTFTAASTEVSAKSGSAAVFTFTFTPANPATTFPFAVSLTASGLPTGATAVFSPAGIAAGAGTTKDTLTIQLPQAAAAAHSAIDLCRTLAPFSLALVLLPFAGSWRKGGRRLSRMISVSLLLFLGVVAAASVSGCGASSSKPQAYTVTVTGTSNNLSSSTTVTLTVD